ncbi:hypothetical protein Pcinc_035503 [Petrolisthes cinctipes]|uniref:Uncharacterized protein n=1 Tax=Petrolisthes cinctipes TaxID=88211 RepID=A0AAE1BY66_PETCI|nr:hypothetical protein Pcinc_035503 [Petrolisthes cinctipes]
MEDVPVDNMDYYLPMHDEDEDEDEEEEEDEMVQTTETENLPVESEDEDSVDIEEDSPVVNVDARKVRQVVVTAPCDRNMDWFKATRPIRFLHVKEGRKRHPRQEKKTKRVATKGPSKALPSPKPLPSTKSTPSPKPLPSPKSIPSPNTLPSTLKDLKDIQEKRKALIHQLVGLERKLKQIKTGTRQYESMIRRYRRLLLSCIKLENQYLDVNKNANTKTLDLLQARYDDLNKH